MRIDRRQLNDGMDETANILSINTPQNVVGGEGGVMGGLGVLISVGAHSWKEGSLMRFVGTFDDLCRMRWRE